MLVSITVGLWGASISGLTAVRGCMGGGRLAASRSQLQDLRPVIEKIISKGENYSEPCIEEDASFWALHFFPVYDSPGLRFHRLFHSLPMSPWPPSARSLWACGPILETPSVLAKAPEGSSQFLRQLSLLISLSHLLPKFLWIKLGSRSIWSPLSS